MGRIEVSVAGDIGGVGGRGKVSRGNEEGSQCDVGSFYIRILSDTAWNKEFTVQRYLAGNVQL